MVGFNRKGGIDNTNVRITSRNFIMRSLLRLLVRLLQTDALLAFRPPSNKCRSHTIRIASLSQISNANSGTDVCPRKLRAIIFEAASPALNPSTESVSADSERGTLNGCSTICDSLGVFDVLRVIFF